MSFSEYVVHLLAAIDLSPCGKRGRDCDRPNALGLPCALHYKKNYILNWPLPIGAFQGQWNTTKRRNRITTTTVKNPNWPEANQLAIYKCSWEVEPGNTRMKFNKIPGSQGQRHWATLPHYFAGFVSCFRILIGFREKYKGKFMRLYNVKRYVNR